jgi:hypothetical protein
MSGRPSLLEIEPQSNMKNRELRKKPGIAPRMLK